MMYKVDNAVIMAAGFSSRFAPLSLEKPKGLIEVKGEILIERQIRQLKDAGISRIILVTGYMQECFDYLRKKFGVILVSNPEYRSRNNNGSIWAARDYLGNSYVCSSDNYFVSNPFESEIEGAYYAALYAEGQTDEWCMKEGSDGFISSVTIGGENSWYMLGHTFWDRPFTEQFLAILEQEYLLPKTKAKLWEQIFREHLDVLKMRIRRYADGEILEFDTLDELRTFDESYLDDTRSPILKHIAAELSISERDIRSIQVHQDENGETDGFQFQGKDSCYKYLYASNEIKKVSTEWK